MNKLYVIGNGFDLHHGMACGYNDFKEWLENNRQDVFNNLKRLYGDIDADWWSKFEENLARFDSNYYPNMIGRDSFFDIQIKLVELYGDEARAVIDDYEQVDLGGVGNRYNLAEAIAQFEMIKLSNGLKEAFGAWVKDIEIKDENHILNLNTEATFFTFNYTKTLEILYKVDGDNVFHLHGSVDNNEFIFGHGCTFGDMLFRDVEENAYDREITDNMADFAARTEMFNVIHDELNKPVEDIIDKNLEHFRDLEGIEEMEVLGFSYSKIDLPYLRKVFEIAGDNIHVIFGWHTKEDKQNAEEFKTEMGLTNCELKYF